EKLELGARANVLLATRMDARQAQDALSKHWKLADAELDFVSLTNTAGVELRSRRVFLDPQIVRAAATLGGGQSRVLTYFVNELESGGRTTPYSMVTAAEPPLAPTDLAPNEIVISQWLADDLQIGPGATLRMRYFV